MKKKTDSCIMDNVEVVKEQKLVFKKRVLIGVIGY